MGAGGNEGAWYKREREDIFQDAAHLQAPVTCWVDTWSLIGI